MPETARAWGTMAGHPQLTATSRREGETPTPVRCQHRAGIGPHWKTWEPPLKVPGLLTSPLSRSQSGPSLLQPLQAGSPLAPLLCRGFRTRRPRSC